ncbi:MAG TPA: class I SAM-dependent methyltransferase [Thermoanaerobaculia bacterium]|nr:class I SAM-dependent methyltransferase [Thermoanaerobaculia bacterium]
MGERQVWNEHWQKLQRGESILFGVLASLVRRAVLRPAVRHYTERYFPSEGVFVEMGCGTAQASTTIRPGDRLLVGLDFSLPVLLDARRSTAPHRYLLGGDIRELPFRDNALSGIWNLGVMEHFPSEDGRAILREFLRVLRPGATAVLFWPPSFSSSRWVLAPIEAVRSRLRGRPFRFFPDEVNRLRSRRHGQQTLREGGFEPRAVKFTPRDALIHLVAVGKKPAA